MLGVYDMSYIEERDRGKEECISSDRRKKSRPFASKIEPTGKDIYYGTHSFSQEEWERIALITEIRLLVRFE